MTVTIVIPAFNHGRYLPACIESALAQTYPVSVTVVDDGSTDDTATIAGRYPVRLIQQPNAGCSAARNVGIKAADTLWALCLDADDMLEPNAIEAMIGLDQIVAPSVHTFGACDSGWVPELAHPTFADFFHGNYSIVSGLYLREVWAAIGGYDEAMRDGAEDWDFWIRATHAGYSMTVVSDKLLRYRTYDRPQTERACSSGRLRERKEEVRAYMRDKYQRMGLCETLFSPAI